MNSNLYAGSVGDSQKFLTPVLTSMTLVLASEIRKEKVMVSWELELLVGFCSGCVPFVV